MHTRGEDERSDACTGGGWLAGQQGCDPAEVLATPAT
jgi:hypothetical protein